jgi:hypothetical protein
VDGLVRRPDLRRAPCGSTIRPWCELRGAGLDVYGRAPVPPQLPALDHIVLLLHVGSGTDETRQAMVRLLLAAAGRPVLTSVKS